jgi:hypothetical protein
VVGDAGKRKFEENSLFKIFFTPSGKKLQRKWSHIIRHCGGKNIDLEKKIFGKGKFLPQDCDLLKKIFYWISSLITSKMNNRRISS